MVPRISTCTQELFIEINNYIHQFELDNRELIPDEFLTIINKNGLLGFGRIREFTGFSELCSLGVVEAERLKGLGVQLTKALIEKAKQPLYLVSIIPHFFEQIGFSICEEYPDAIAQKLDYCITQLPVEEKYVVMRYIGQ